MERDTTPGELDGVADTQGHDLLEETLHLLHITRQSEDG